MLKADKSVTEDDDDFVVPPEKERKRLVLVISCIGLTMTFLAAIMVGITLGLSHMLDQKVTRELYLDHIPFIIGYSTCVMIGYSKVIFGTCVPFWVFFH